MAIKIGDKVRFLNSTGGGTVVKLKGKDLAIVEDEDGFEVPVLARECVVVAEAGTPAATRTAAPAYAASPASKPAAGSTPKETRQAAPEPEYVPEETPGGDLLQISLAFLPAEGQASNPSGFEAFLINESNYYLLFNYMSTPGSGWTSRCNGLIEPNTQLRIDEFALEVLNNFSRIALQFIAFKEDKPYSLKRTYSLEQPLNAVKFYKQTTFAANDYFDDGAWIIPLVKNDQPVERITVNPKELQEAMMRKAAQDKAPAPKAAAPEKARGNDILEIDLHIHQLLDSIAGLSNSDILQYQLDKFHEILQEYAGKKGQKIVFIHGKGDGVLRKAIEKELRTRYKTYYVQDASFKEYGFGATMVTIK
ncbi:MAG: DUF2027 domain-containing protein [Parabacteroides sp.]|nr:DUF2027 domain-containing protein [Parabacteroides sp.]